jgi:hypothetical protein
MAAKKMVKKTVKKVTKKTTSEKPSVFSKPSPMMNTPIGQATAGQKVTTGGMGAGKMKGKGTGAMRSITGKQFINGRGKLKGKGAGTMKPITGKQFTNGGGKLKAKGAGKMTMAQWEKSAEDKKIDKEALAKYNKGKGAGKMKGKKC